MLVGSCVGAAQITSSSCDPHSMCVQSVLKNTQAGSHCRGCRNWDIGSPKIAVLCQGWGSASSAGLICKYHEWHGRTENPLTCQQICWETALCTFLYFKTPIDFSPTISNIFDPFIIWAAATTFNKELPSYLKLKRKPSYASKLHTYGLLKC